MADQDLKNLSEWRFFYFSNVHICGGFVPVSVIQLCVCVSAQSSSTQHRFLISTVNFQDFVTHVPSIARRTALGVSVNVR